MPSPREFHGVAVEVDAAARERTDSAAEGTRSPAPTGSPRRRASGSPETSTSSRVDDVGDLVVDVDTERAQRDADLVGRQSGAARLLDRLDEVGDQRGRLRVPEGDRIALGAQHRVAEEADGPNGHASSSLPPSPSIDRRSELPGGDPACPGAAPRSRRPRPAASAGSYGMKTTARTLRREVAADLVEPGHARTRASRC